MDATSGISKKVYRNQQRPINETKIINNENITKQRSIIYGARKGSQ